MNYLISLHVAAFKWVWLRNTKLVKEKPKLGTTYVISMKIE